MLLLLGIALPLAILGFGIDSGDEEEALDEVTLEGSEDPIALKVTRVATLSMVSQATT
jgi:hypothetical protein